MTSRIALPDCVLNGGMFNLRYSSRDEKITEKSDEKKLCRKRKKPVEQHKYCVH